MLMKTLIEKAQRCLELESNRPGEGTLSLDDTISVLDLAHKAFVSSSSPALSALLSLSFYSSIGFGDLRPRLSSSHQVFIIERLAEYLKVSHSKLQQLDASTYVTSRDRVAGDCVSWAKVSLSLRDTQSANSSRRCKRSGSFDLPGSAVGPSYPATTSCIT